MRAITDVKLPHGDTLMCQIWYASVNEQRLSCQDTNSWWKYNFDMKAKGQGHTDVAHCPMVKHSCAKYGVTMSKDKTYVARTQNYDKNI